MKLLSALTPAELTGKYVLVRSSLDLPLNEVGEVADVFRLKQSFATLEYLRKNGARSIVVAKIGRDPKESMAPVASAMKSYLPTFFVPALTGPAVTQARAAMKNGDIILLENLQQDPREVAGDDTFAKELASLAHLYVNDCFPSAHRKSASMIGIPKFLPSYAGFQLAREVQELSGALNPPTPSIAIIGGAKFETKDPIIRSFLTKYDHVCVVGAIANDVLKAKGFPIGRSKISEHPPSLEVVSHPHLLAPVDVTVEKPDKQVRVVKPSEVEDDDKIVDIGPDTIAALAPLLEQAQFILWNGPTGLYEEGYTSYTLAIAELIPHATERGAKAVIGGGDTVAVIEENQVPQEKLGFLSTGGGAMLEYLLDGTLPGIEALG